MNERLEVQLVDGIIHSFQEKTTEDEVMLDGFGTVVDALGEFAISPQYILCGLELVYYLGRSNYR